MSNQEISKEPPWSPDQIQMLARLWAGNLSRLEIARRIGRSPGAVSVQASRLGLGSRTGNRGAAGALPMRDCNLCGKSFRPANRFIRICNHCRTSEDYQVSGDWLVLHFDV